MVKTRPFQGLDTGSNPAGSIYIYIKDYFLFFYILEEYNIYFCFNFVIF